MAKVSIYGCGGAGANIVQSSLGLTSALEMPEINISIIDTSRSNIRINLEKENIGHTFVAGLTGGGKDQRLAFESAKPYINDHLNKNKPGDFNLVVFSLSGASGPATGSLITDELLRRKLPVICLIIGSVEDGKQATNTFNTLNTLQNLSKQHGLPLTVMYHENVYNGNNEARLGDENYINDIIYLGMRDICRLVSENHHGLDREDIRNWLYFNKISDTPSLVELFTSSNHSDMKNVDGKVITSASLLPNQLAHVPELMQPYSCKGYISEALLKEFGDEFEGYHYLITKGFIKGTYNRVKARKLAFEESLKKLQEADDSFDDEFDSGSDPFTF